MPTIDQLRELEKLLNEATEPDIELMLKAGDLFEIGDFHSYWLWIGNRAYTEAALALLTAEAEQHDWAWEFAVDNFGYSTVYVEKGLGPSTGGKDNKHPALAILRALVAAMIQQKET